MERFLNEAVYGTKPSAIRQFSALAKATPGCIALTLGEPDFDTPEVVTKEAQESLSAGDTHYITNNGSASLLEKISEYEAQSNGLSYSPSEIIVTAGATEALFVALFGIINPGDEVIIPVPAFVLYEEIIKLCRGEPIFLDTTPDGFAIDENKLSCLINEKTKAIILNSPNNPTGCVLDSKSLDAVYSCVKDKNIFVICDDVYRQLVYEGEYHSFAERQDLRKQIIVVQSFSKPYAMTGWRMGYLMADEAIKTRLQFIHQFMVVSTPAPFQKACETALGYSPAPMLEIYRKRRQYVLSRLEKMGLETCRPAGAFYVFPSIEKFGLSSSDFCTRMISEAGLAATPGSCFGGEGHIRLTYCYSDEELKEGLDRLEGFINKLSSEK